MPFDKQPCSSALTPCASALTLTPRSMVGWTGTWLMALLEPPTMVPSPIPGLSLYWMCCWQRTDGLRGRLNGGSKHTNNHIQRLTNRPTHIKTDTDICMWREAHGRGCAHKHTRTAQASRKDLAMLHLFVFGWNNGLHKYNTQLICTPPIPPLWWLVPETTMKHGGHWKAWLSIISSEGGGKYNSYL